MKTFVVALVFIFISFISGTYWGSFLTAAKFEAATKQVQPTKGKPRVWT